jgi:hypothetical protein
MHTGYRVRITRNLRRRVKTPGIVCELGKPSALASAGIVACAPRNHSTQHLSNVGISTYPALHSDVR